VYRQISDSLFWANTRLRRARVRAGLRRAARVVALWPGAADTLQHAFRVPMNRVDVVPNGVPGDRFTPAAADERQAARRDLGIAASAPVVGYVGALAREKGVDVLVRAMRSCVDATLLIAGDGSERASLQRLAEPWRDRIVFLGPLQSVRPVYAAADVIALPSRAGDSMPAVLIEAALMGLPAVSTSVDAIPQIVRDGRTGVLVPPGDEVALGNALRRLIDDHARRRVLGAAARAHCGRHYTIAAVSRQWSDTLSRATRPSEPTAWRRVRATAGST
jgi:glycosyltransferase involved in cell wall biosynthesis